MSKRKATAGGYNTSSDDVEIENTNVAKKPKPVYAPPRLSAIPEPMSGFQLPRPKPPPFARSSGTPGPIKSTASRSQLSDPESEVAASQSAGVIHTLNSKIGGGGPGSCGVTRPPPQPTYARTNLSLERRVNELANIIEMHKESSDEHQRRTDEKLTRLLEVMTQLTPENVAFGQASASRDASTGPVVPSAEPHFSNPRPTAELIAIVSRVVSASRNRVGKKKGGAEEKSRKEHARNVFYRMLGIHAAKDIGPYFEDQFGEPDTLPEQFTDPETGYCRPYPHWGKPLNKQVDWIPTYIQRFRSMIPNNQSDLSAILRGLSNEEIVVLLHDGPFKSARAQWSGDGRLETMRSNARRYQRRERKSIVCAGYIKAIPSLQGPQWEYLSHLGYMSEDESDSEGIVTKRPEHRAQWVNDFFDAIRVAEREKAKARPGFSSNPPQRTIELVNRPIPQLERGADKSIVRIAACSVSERWKDQYPKEFAKYAHLIDSAPAEPDINRFLAKYRMPTASEVNEVGKGGKGGEGGEGGESFDFSLYGGDYDIPSCGSRPMESDAVPMDDVVFRLPGTYVEGEAPGAPNSGDKADINFPINPQLLAANPCGFAGRLRSAAQLRLKVLSDVVNVHAVPPSADSAPTSMLGGQPLDHGVDRIAPGPAHDSRSLGVSSQLPPPPPPPQESEMSNSNNVPKDNGPKTRGPRTGAKQGKTPSSSTAQALAAAPPKKRGRPLGSKNKPKPKA